MSIETILLLIVSWLLAAILTFAIELSVLLTTFWLDDIESPDNFVVFSSYIFSGQFIPLIAFPQAIQSFPLFSPFRYILSFPVEIFTGRIIGWNIPVGFALQISWCIIMIFLCRLLWKKGLIRYSAVGA
ncbi:ABC-2 family transporter protein [Candidatus Collierbacteria bacterium]|nr:ABC-2 family transporter protein [Candidatus Collierbacteria bacterium]